jgi:hypothetical protein
MKRESLTSLRLTGCCTMQAPRTPMAPNQRLQRPRPHRHPDRHCCRPAPDPKAAWVPRGNPKATTSSVKRLRVSSLPSRPKSKRRGDSRCCPATSTRHPILRRGPLVGERALEALLHQRVRCLDVPLLAASKPDSSLGLVPLQDLPAFTAGYAPISRWPYPATGFDGANASIDTPPDCVCPVRQSHEPKPVPSSWGF